MEALVMARMHMVEYAGTIDELAQADISVSKGVVQIGDEEFKLKGHGKLNDADRLTFHELPGSDKIAIELSKRGQTNGGEDDQIKIVKADGTESFVNAIKDEATPEALESKEPCANAGALKAAPAEDVATAPIAEITAPSKTHDINYDGTISELAVADIEINKGILSIDGEDFKLAGHRQVNEANRLVVNEGPDGDISVDILKRGHDNNGQEGEILIITASGDKLYKNIDAVETPEVKAEVEAAPDAPTEPETPAIDDVPAPVDQKDNTQTGLVTAFVSPAEETPTEMVDLIASNAGDMMPVEMDEVPSELTMGAEQKVSMNVTA